MAGFGTPGDIYQTNANGSDEQNLTRAEGYDSLPSYSPNGKIAFNSDRPSPDGTTDLEIWRMRASDGVNPTNLTDNAVFDPERQPVP